MTPKNSIKIVICNIIWIIICYINVLCNICYINMLHIMRQIILKNIYTNNSQTEYLNIVPLPLFQNYPTQNISYRVKCFLSNNHHYWKNTLFADIMWVSRSCPFLRWWCFTLFFCKTSKILSNMWCYPCTQTQIWYGINFGLCSERLFLNVTFVVILTRLSLQVWIYLNFLIWSIWIGCDVNLKNNHKSRT